MARPGNAVVAGILESSYLLMSIYGCYSSGQSGLSAIYMLGVVAVEVSHRLLIHTHKKMSIIIRPKTRNKNIKQLTKKDSNGYIQLDISDFKNGGANYAETFATNSPLSFPSETNIY